MDRNEAHSIVIGSMLFTGLMVILASDTAHDLGAFVYDFTHKDKASRPTHQNPLKPEYAVGLAVTTGVLFFLADVWPNMAAVFGLLVASGALTINGVQVAQNLGTWQDTNKAVIGASGSGKTMVA